MYEFTPPQRNLLILLMVLLTGGIGWGLRKNAQAPPVQFIAGAQAFLERRPVEKPFCLTIAFNLPHNAGTSSMELRPSDPELYRTTYRDQLETQPIPRTYVAR